MFYWTKTLSLWLVSMLLHGITALVSLWLSFYAVLDYLWNRECSKRKKIFDQKIFSYLRCSYRICNTLQCENLECVAQVLLRLRCNFVFDELCGDRSSWLFRLIYVFISVFSIKFAQGPLVWRKKNWVYLFIIDNFCHIVFLYFWHRQ